MNGRIMIAITLEILAGFIDATYFSADLLFVCLVNISDDDSKETMPPESSPRDYR